MLLIIHENKASSLLVISDLLNCQRNLVAWKNDSFGNIQKQLRDKRRDLNLLMKGHPDDSLISKVKILHSDINLLLEREELMWKQRFGALCLNARDQNKKFYHKKAYQRRTRDFISRLGERVWSWKQLSLHTF